MRTATHFYLLAILVGMVQGGTQALSRSLFASMIPKHKSSEFFAFFGVFERYAGILGPAVFAWVVAHSGTSRNAILSVLAFFIIGGALLTLVDVDEGPGGARASSASRTSDHATQRARVQDERLHEHIQDGDHQVVVRVGLRKIVVVGVGKLGVPDGGVIRLQGFRAPAPDPAGRACPCPGCRISVGFFSIAACVTGEMDEQVLAHLPDRARRRIPRRRFSSRAGSVCSM